MTAAWRRYHPGFGCLHESLVLSGADVAADAKPAIVAGDRTVTYGRMRDSAAGLSSTLVARGVGRGDRVVIYTGNTAECAVSVFAALWAGAAFVIVNDQVKSEKLAEIMADCEPAALIVDAALASRTAWVSSLRLVVVSGVAGAAEAPDDRYGCPVMSYRTAISIDAGFAPQKVAPLDLAALIYTSGSTGEPKGVMMTHLSMRFAVESLSTYLRLSPNDTIINFLPLSFDYGLYQLLMAVHLGATLVLESSFVYPSTIVNAVNDHGVTVFPGVPTVYSMLVSLHRKTGLTLPTVHAITNTAAALSDDLIPDLKSIFPNALVFKMYGLTECKRVAYLEPEELDAKPGSVGKAIPGTEVFLRGANGEDVGVDERGILHVRGPHVMLGYWNKPERSAEMLVPGRYPYERTLRTGDWFRMDDEGYLYFEGRSDDIIKTRGEKVSPVEVERMIRRLPSVQEASVFGIPDAVLGQTIAAVVEPRPDEELSEQAVKAHCAKYLEGFMVPKRVAVVEHMPRSANGKLDRKSLPALFVD